MEPPGPRAQPDSAEGHDGERRDADETRECRSDHTKGEPAITPHDDLLRFFRGERPVLERESVGPTAARQRVSRLGIFREGDDFVAARTTYPVRQGGGPATALLPNPNRMARAVRTVDHVSALDVPWAGDPLTAIQPATSRGDATPNS